MFSSFFILAASFAAVVSANPLRVVTARDATCQPNFQGAAVGISTADGFYEPSDAPHLFAWRVEQNGQWPTEYIIKDIKSLDVLTLAPGGSTFLFAQNGSAHPSQSFAIACQTCDPNASSGPDRDVATKCTIKPHGKPDFCLTSAGINHIISEPCTGANNQFFNFAV
ncbi:hypothetical protein Moror_16886 [Moniliophthora roreri MCA 2997]|uniref:Uncharacterized protein n=2 Tax=Moniliophthora roreri TaxID=221103 RepID=V2XB95_MONRO|nr:hypothetical protein Moror_16886 [Moniliophthora roreri MCA 2997]KAI3620916.1 hypothetical protein WG66_006239 [Moniliophthora roreri]